MDGKRVSHRERAPGKALAFYQDLPNVGKAVGLKSRQRGLNLGDLRQQTWGHFDRSIPV
jgi:hypothetical protein